jgi:hypothetical protein
MQSGASNFKRYMQRTGIAVVPFHVNNIVKGITRMVTWFLDRFVICSHHLDIHVFLRRRDAASGGHFDEAKSAAGGSKGWRRPYSRSASTPTVRLCVVLDLKSGPGRPAFGYRRCRRRQVGRSCLLLLLLMMGCSGKQRCGGTLQEVRLRFWMKKWRR